MKIRIGKISEVDEIKKVIMEALKDIYRSFDIKWEDFGGYVKIIVAEDEGEIIGCAAIKKVNGDIVKLKRMYVLPKMQRNGVGKMLLDAVLDFCKQENYKRILLTTYPEMNKAIKFYKKNLFVVVENPGDEFFTNPKLKEYNSRQVAMERDLSDGGANGRE